jgi:hypothetical protein
MVRKRENIYGKKIKKEECLTRRGAMWFLDTIPYIFRPIQSTYLAHSGSCQSPGHRSRPPPCSGTTHPLEAW